jgi:hypothetical protein
VWQVDDSLLERWGINSVIESWGHLTIYKIFREWIVVGTKSVWKDTVMLDDAENDIFWNDVKVGTDVEYHVARRLVHLGVLKGA